MKNNNGEGNQINLKMPAISTGFVDMKWHNNLVRTKEFLGNVELKIEGNNFAIDVARMRRTGRLRVTCKNGGSVSIGELSTAEDLYILADGASVRLGRDCMASFQVAIRTTNAHGIYDVATGELLNRPQNFSIGDHVWIGQGAIVAKGSVIGKNSVIGAMSYLTSRRRIIPKALLRKRS